MSTNKKKILFLLYDKETLSTYLRNFWLHYPLRVLNRLSLYEIQRSFCEYFVLFRIFHIRCRCSALRKFGSINMGFLQPFLDLVNHGTTCYENDSLKSPFYLRQSQSQVKGPFDNKLYYQLFCYYASVHKKIVVNFDTFIIKKCVFIFFLS